MTPLDDDMTAAFDGPDVIPPGATPEVVAAWTDYRRQATWYFRASVALTSAVTALWLGLLLMGPGRGLLGSYRVNLEALQRVAGGFATLTVVWGWLWYRFKRLLLRKLVGLSNDEVRSVFQSRMSEPFDLPGLLARHSERRIRIADMIGRRGRFLMIGVAGYSYIYTRVARNPTPDFLYLGLHETLFDALAYSWLMLAFYYSDGFLGRVSYGAQARIMDGTLGRANCLVITMLWSVFKFIMVPLGYQLASVFPPQTYAAVFALVWLSYITGDGLSEIAGQLFGRQKLRVWGIGEVNRKSVTGTWACFLGSLATCLIVVASSGLGGAWIGLSVAIAVSNTGLELFSPRGTDDFTMATANALLCLGFGALVL